MGSRCGSCSGQARAGTVSPQECIQPHRLPGKMRRPRAHGSPCPTGLQKGMRGSEQAHAAFYSSAALSCPNMGPHLAGRSGPQCGHRAQSGRSCGATPVAWVPGRETPSRLASPGCFTQIHACGHQKPRKRPGKEAWPKHIPPQTGSKSRGRGRAQGRNKVRRRVTSPYPQEV